MTFFQRLGQRKPLVVVPRPDRETPQQHVGVRCPEEILGRPEQAARPMQMLGGSVVEADPFVSRSKCRRETGGGCVPAFGGRRKDPSFPLPAEAVGARGEPALRLHRPGRKGVAAAVQLSLVAGWALAVRDEHPPAIADSSEPGIFDRDGICHVRVERKPARRGIERLGTPRLDDVDAPAPIKAVHVADVEPPRPAVTKDRAALDRGAAEIFSGGAPDRSEMLAVASRDPQLTSTAWPRPAQPIDQIYGVAVAKRSWRARPMTRPRIGRRFN